MARTEQTAVRLDEGTVARLDAMRPHLSTIGHNSTMSDALRAAVLTGLDVLEKAHGVKAPVSMADPMKGRAGK